MPDYLLDHDAVKTRWFEFDEMTGEKVIKTQYHGTQKALDLNKAVQGRDVGKNSDDSQRLMASIPPEIIHKWLVEEGLNIFRKEDWAKIAAKLDSNEYRHLRVNTGRIGRRPQYL